jgi:hypothetical protein
MGNSFSSTSAVAAFSISPLESAEMPSLYTLFSLKLTATVQDETGVHTVGPGRSGQIRAVMENGTTSGKADVAFSRVMEVVDYETPLQIVLSDGSMVSPSGNASSFAKVTQFCFRNLSNWVMRVGGGTGAPLWLPLIPVPPGGTILFNATGSTVFAVTPTTGDKVNVSSDEGSAIEFELTVVGRSA